MSIYIAWLIKFFSFVGPLYFKFFLSQLGLTHILSFISEYKFNTHYSLSYSFTYFPYSLYDMCVYLIFITILLVLTTPCSASFLPPLMRIYNVWKLLSCVWLFVTPVTVQSMEFSRQITGVCSLFLLQGSSQPRDRTRVSHIGDRHFNLWATREARYSYYSWIYFCLELPLPQWSQPVVAVV